MVEDILGHPVHVQMYILWIRTSVVYNTVMEPYTAVHVVFQLASLLIRVNSPI